MEISPHLKKLFIIQIFLLNLIITHAIYSSNLLSSDSKPIFDIIGKESGLSNLSVSSIIQDKYGFLWFGTQGGLNKYDGRNFTTYKHSPFDEYGLGHNLIQTMYYDANNHEIWIGTYQGMSRFIIAEDRFINYTVEEDNLSNPVTIAITIDEDGNVWSGTMEGLNKIDPNSRKVTHYNIPGNVVRALAIGSNGNLYIGTYQGLFHYDKTSDSIKKIELELPSEFVMTIKEYEPNILTLGLWDGGVSFLDLKTNEIKTETFADNRVYTITQTNDKTLWIGTWGGGLFAVTPDEGTFHFEGKGENPPLPHPIVYSLIQDHSDILWVGTNGGGIAKINPRKKDYLLFSHNPENPNSLNAGKINSILRDTKGNLWIAVYESGLNKYIQSEDKMIEYRHNSSNPNLSIPDDKIGAIYEGKDGKIYFTSGKGVFYYDYGTDDFYELDYFPKDLIVYAIAETSQSEFWFGTYNNGLYHYDPITEKLTQYEKNGDNNISDNLIYTILIDSKDRVWVGTNDGLNVLEPNKSEFKIYKKSLKKPNQLGSNTIRIIYEDSNSRIWIGLNGGGLVLYNEENDNFISYLEKDGLSSNTILGILEGTDGRIWLSTMNGISILDPKDGEIFTLTPNDGIGGWEFNTAHFRDNDGTLFFGGVHGITGIPSDFSHHNLIAPQLYITDVEIFQNPIDSDYLIFNDQNITFSPQDDFLGFRFVALDYDAPEKITFSYKLEGFDSEWIQAGNRDYVSYSNLKPGNYTFKVRAKTYRGVSSDTEKFSFKIEKPWYLTNIAYVLYSGLFILFVFGVTKIREQYLLSKKNSELSIMNQKLKEINLELEKTSVKDPLTNLYNRRYFAEKFEELISLAKRSNTPISLLMLDVDNFKPLNDTYGHLAGDSYLTDLSKTIQTILSRNTDFAARYGGDEFVIVLYDTDSNGANVVANNIRKSICDITLNINSFHSKKPTKPTLSIGLVTIIPDKNSNINTYVKLADKALYQAKENGRNCVVIHSKL